MFMQIASLCYHSCPFTYHSNEWSEWMLVCVVTIHNYSNVTQLADELGKCVTDAISGVDAITGSDDIRMHEYRLSYSFC